MSQTTLTPEFLHEGYMQTLPFTQVPVANVWDIVCWMSQRQRRRFAEQYS